MANTNVATTPPGSKTAAAAKNVKKATAKGKETGEKKTRAPRKDYGFAKGATIHLTEGEKAYRGNRLRWYGYLKEANGKTVEEFFKLAEKAGEKDAPRGWLRFFIQNEAATLTAPPASK